ncbi:13242_t:CDS:2, partial [Acaulospora colombiana]
RLTIDQLLCLLEENSGSTPDSFSRKPDILGLVIKPKGKSTTPLPPRQHISTSEALVDRKEPRPVPTIMQVASSTVGTPPVISRLDLEEIQQDIPNIVTPSWFTKISSQVGEISNGKLKADEWRSLFTVYLPLSMTRLWASSKHHRLHLKSLLILSIIVNITCSTTISGALIKCFNDAIRLYLRIISVEDGCSLVIKHHLSLHLTTFMEAFGPCRTYWAFPYERLIGKLQRTLYSPSIGMSGASSQSHR